MGHEPVFDITVEQDHSYIANGIIVHNCGSPNLQQVPSRDEDGRQIREIFISRWRDKGGKILAADYSQAELRILAHISEDENLLSIFRKEGSDIHRGVAAQIYNIPEEEVTDSQRSKTKAVNFGIIYGMGPKKLAAETGMSIKEAQIFIEDYLNNFPGVRKFIQNSEIFLRENGYTETVFGRRRYAEGFNEKEKQLNKLKDSGASFEEKKELQTSVWATIRQAQNHIIQGTCADIIKLAMIKVDEELKNRMLNSIIILQVHDEIVLDVYPGEEDTVLKLVRDCFESAVNFKVKMVCDVNIKNNWAEAH